MARILKQPVKSTRNIEVNKYYVFNETGNILISSTVDNSQPIEKEVQEVFAEVSVFFAGMTRAISTTPNPEDKGKPYSIYNANALNSIIGGSGLFVSITKEDIMHSSSSFGADFSKELIEGLVGLATGTGELAFAAAMVEAMGKEGLRINASESSADTHIANIIFVCEYLLGMPTISAIVISMDAKKHIQQIKAGPCFNESSSSVTLAFTKETYLFVPPTFIKNYSADLVSVESNPQYIEFINWLQGLISHIPKAMNVVENTESGVKIVQSGTALRSTKSYIIEGQFLPTDHVTLKFVGEESQITGTVTSTVGTLSPTEIGFSVSGSQTLSLPIGIYKNGKLVISTPATFKIESSPTTEKKE